MAAAAAGRLQARLPIFRVWSPTAPHLDTRTIPRSWAGSRRRFRAARPALVLVGLGFAQQERLISSLRSEMPQTWFVGVGISFSFLAREQP